MTVIWGAKANASAICEKHPFEYAGPALAAPYRKTLTFALGSSSLAAARRWRLMVSKPT